MRKMILLLAVIISFFISEGISSGVTLEEAIAEIDAMWEEGNLKPKAYAMAVSAMERLTAIGISVDTAYQLVIVGIEHNITDKKFAPMVRFIEIDVPTSGIVVADIATTAIKKKYNHEEVEDIIRVLDTGVKAGAGNDIPAEIILMAVEKGIKKDDIKYIVENFVEDIKNGLSPEEAKGKALKDIEKAK